MVEKINEIDDYNSKNFSPQDILRADDMNNIERQLVVLTDTTNKVIEVLNKIEDVNNKSY